MQYFNEIFFTVSLAFYHLRSKVIVRFTIGSDQTCVIIR